MIFFDMDGTIAKFYHDKQCLEKMYERDYFFALKPYKLAEYVNELASKRKDIYILSACIDSPYCEQEKRDWLRIYIPNLPESHYIFTKTGEDKATIIEEKLGKPTSTRILIDDYSKNIFDWESKGRKYVAIKYLNGMNNKSGKVYSLKAKTIKQIKSLLSFYGYSNI